MIKQEIQDLISQKKARIGVIGLGYVGLPLVVEFARNGFSGIGFEVDQRKADEINAGRSYIPDVPSDHVAESVKADRLQATTDFAHLKTCDIIIICVPTPLRKTKDPDMSYILSAAEKIQENLRRGQLIILESTTYPGTTDEVLLPMFEEKGFKLDEDFLLAFSPERVDPGNPQFLTHNITKVVGGVTEDSTEVSAQLYAEIVETVHPVTSARVAEAAKLWENTFRAVNIGMANEMAKLCNTLGIDTWEVVRAAKTKPFGFMAFYPGPGIGGHCLVGSESAVVRSGNLESVKMLENIFAEESAKPNSKTFNADGADVVYQPNLQALSLNPSTQMPEWKPISHIFRRQVKTKLVTVTTSDNRKLTTTDKHPFLIADESGNLREIFAENLQVNQCLPIFAEAALAATATANVSGNTQTFRKAVTSPVKSIEIFEPEMPVEVYSLEVEDNHTFAASYGIFVHNCIPLDPHYLSWKARQHGFDSRFISLAEEVNSSMPQHVVGMVRDALNDDGKAVKNSKILILGVAYKKDIDDMRESPALSIIDLLRAKGAMVEYHDPFVPEVVFDHSHTLGHNDPLYTVEFTDERLKAADCVVIVTEHSGVDYQKVCELSRLVVDTRNALNEQMRGGSKARIVRL